jgi:hypothetical protein
VVVEFTDMEEFLEGIAKVGLEVEKVTLEAKTIIVLEEYVR